MSLSPLRRLVGVSIATLALAGGLAACGGDDTPSSSGSSTSTPSSPSTAPESTETTEATATDDDFVAQANAVCEALYPEINAVSVDITPDDPTTVEPFVPLVQELQDQLDALTPPDDLADAFAAVMAEQQSNLDAITADPAALFTIDGGSINEEFDAIGITSCGSGSADIS